MLTLLLSFEACVSDENCLCPEESVIIELRDTAFVMNIKEPSGLALLPAGDAFYTVSDNTGAIYKVSNDGKTLSVLPFRGSDPEGVAVDRTSGDIYVVEEGLQLIDHIKPDGSLFRTISNVRISTSNPSSGFEGIAINGDTLYVVFEKDPGVLIEYHLPTGMWTQRPLLFATDYSGIDYDANDNTLWIISDESRTLNHCTLNGNLLTSQVIDVNKPEGVVVDSKERIFWVVSDSENKLYSINLKIK